MTQQNDQDKARFRVELFGWTRVHQLADGQDLRVSGKPLAFLAYLACHPGQNLPREKLAYIFWAKRGEDQARQSLRQMLTALRKLLGNDAQNIISTQGDNIVFDPQHVTCDVWEFDTRSKSSDLATLESALALYRGPLLTDVRSASSEFDEWASQARRSREVQAADVFERVIAALFNAGRLTEARDYALSLIEIDPAHEPGHRFLMRIYAGLEQRSAALHQYDQCRQELARRLDAAPSEETEALAAEIRQGVEATTSATRGEDESAPASGSRSPASPATRPTRKAGLSQRQLTAAIALAGGAVVAAGLVWGLNQPEADRADTVAANPTCPAVTRLVAERPTLIVQPLDYAGENPALRVVVAAAQDHITYMASLMSGLAIIHGPPEGHPDSDMSPVELAGRTGATLVLTGTVVEVGDDIRIFLRLVDGENGEMRWNPGPMAIEGPDIDPLLALNEIAIAAMSAVYRVITDGAQSLVYPSYAASDLQVLEHNTRGYDYVSRLDPVLNALAREEFEASLAIAPNNPGAHTGMAFSILSPMIFRWETGSLEDVAEAKRHAEAALQASPRFPSALSALSIALLFEGDHAEAMRRGREAIEASGGADANAFLAYVASYSDAPQTALDLANRAIASRPYLAPPWYAWNYARALRVSGQFEASIGCFGLVDVNRPDALAPAIEMVLAHDALGETDEARAAARNVRAQSVDGLSLREYCTWPPHADREVETACLNTLRRYGLTD